MRNDRWEALDDDELARRAGGEPAAFEALYGRYARRVFGLLATMRADPHAADDIAQQAWLKAWRGLAGRPDGSPFGPWLMQVVRHVAVDHFRRRKSVALPEDAQFAADGPKDVLSDVVEDAELARLRECVGHLPDAERAVFRGRLDGVDSCEVAAGLGLSADRVHRLFFEAKLKLQRCLGLRP